MWCWECVCMRVCDIVGNLAYWCFNVVLILRHASYNHTDFTPYLIYLFGNGHRLIRCQRNVNFNTQIFFLKRSIFNVFFCGLLIIGDKWCIFLNTSMNFTRLIEDNDETCCTSICKWIVWKLPPLWSNWIGQRQYSSPIPLSKMNQIIVKMHTCLPLHLACVNLF